MTTPTPHRRFRFGLRSLFALVTLAALTCAAYRIQPSLALVVAYIGSLVIGLAWLPPAPDLQ